MSDNEALCVERALRAEAEVERLRQFLRDMASDLDDHICGDPNSAQPRSESIRDLLGEEEPS